MIFQIHKRKIKKGLLPLSLVLFVFLISINLLFFTLDNANIVIENESLTEINDLRCSGVSGKISLVGEQGWIDFKDAGNCTGSGSYLDPFVIQDLVIDGQGSGSGIKITLSRIFFFRIENCTIFNCSIGIDLYSTDNGTLYQNDCSFNGVGIYLHCPTMPTPETYGCYNNTIIENIANNNSMYGIQLGWGVSGRIIGNTANNNRWGIYHEGYPYLISGNTANNNEIGLRIWGPGSNTEISGNIAIDNSDSGIDLNTLSVNLTGNVMEGSGLALWPSSIETMSTIHIDTTNLVNSKPVFYLINNTDVSPHSLKDAGQIFLINCTSILVKDVDVSNSSMGISISHSNNITVLNAVSSNNDYGVNLRNTNNSFFINNTFKYNKYGSLFDGLNNTVEGNYIYSNVWTTAEGLTFNLFDDYNKILNNEIVGCIMGLVFKASSHNVISGNIIRDNLYGIVVMGGSEHNLFYENFFRGNNIHVDGGSTTNKWNNTEIGNYWDNYTGLDNNGDGIGDTPHIVDYSSLTLDYLPIVDNLAPVITINSPTSNQEFISSPSFNIRVEEKYVDAMWYTLDGGLNNFTFTENATINQNAWNSLPDGSVNLQFYATDKTGKTGYAEIVINKNSGAIPGINLPLLLVSIFILSLIIVRANLSKLLIRKR